MSLQAAHVFSSCARHLATLGLKCIILGHLKRVHCLMMKASFWLQPGSVFLCCCCFVFWTWGARWQLFSARAIYQADVLTQPRHNKSSHVTTATTNNLAELYFSGPNAQTCQGLAKIKSRQNSAASFRAERQLKRHASVRVAGRNRGRAQPSRRIQRAGCIVWVIYQRQSTKFPWAENLSLLLSSPLRSNSSSRFPKAAPTTAAFFSGHRGKDAFFISTFWSIAFYAAPQLWHDGYKWARAWPGSSVIIKGLA